MRLLAVLAFALALTSCDSAADDPPLACLLGPETEIPGEIRVRITSPLYGDTLRLGEPFRFRAEVEATGAVEGVGVQLVGRDFGVLPETVLFERDLGGGAGSYTLDQEVVLDSIRAGADRSEVYVFPAGRVLTNTACSGGYSGPSANPARVVVLG